MVCKMLLFDLRESEKNFFEKNKVSNFDIKFFTQSLSEKNLSLLDESDFNDTVAISIYKFSRLNAEVLSKFKNLRVIGLRCEDYKCVDLKSCVDKNIAVVNVVQNENEYTTLQKSFKFMTEVLCGCKDNRLV